MSPIYFIFLTILFNVILSGSSLNNNKNVITASECNNTNIQDSKEKENEKNKTVSKNLRHIPDAVQLLVTQSAREKRKKNKDDLFKRIFPMFVIPYLVQSALLPMILMTMKAMIVKSILVGKLALILVAINALRSRAIAAHTHDNTNLLHEHYGYNGNEEFGAYMNGGH